jgi:hypothetical protein
MSAFTLWTAPQACLWIATQNEVQLRELKQNSTFAELAFETELGWDDIDDPEDLPPLPGWIANAQEELLGACVHGDPKLIGRPSSGGASEEIPGPACATARFFCESLERGECLGPPGTPPGIFWRDIRVVADDVRRVWPADRFAAAASSPSSIKRGSTTTLLLPRLQQLFAAVSSRRLAPPPLRAKAIFKAVAPKTRRSGE